MTKTSNYSIAPLSGGKWAVRRSGAARVSSTRPSQEDALGEASRLAAKSRGDVFIFDSTGRVASKIAIARK